jgi:hypothetical protein
LGKMGGVQRVCVEVPPFGCERAAAAARRKGHAGGSVACQALDGKTGHVDDGGVQGDGRGRRCDCR